MKKKAKIITALAVFGLIAAAGYFVERFEKDAFIKEAVVREDMYYSAEGAAVNDNGLININTADSETLEKLHGIGGSLAERIVSYRSTSGGFGTVEEIMNVPGISESKFSDIKDDICVD